MDIPIPKISVIVPVYNVEGYVGKCIESIIDQTYDNLEIILVDDGSTDGSGDICERYSEKDSRIRLIHQENQGASSARSNAIDIAIGAYLGFVDSDDWIEADMYHTLYTNAVTYDADISTCKIRRVSEPEQEISSNSADESIVILEGIDKIADNIHGSIHSLCNKLFKRCLFDDIRLPKGKIYEDLCTTYKLLDEANKVVMSSKEKYNYLSRSDSITHRPFALNYMEVIEASIERYEYITPRYPEFEKECRRYILNNLLWVMDGAYRSGSIERYMEPIQKAIDTVRIYEYSDCGLSAEQVNVLKLLFRSMKSYVAVRRSFDNNKR